MDSRGLRVRAKRNTKRITTVVSSQGVYSNVSHKIVLLGKDNFDQQNQQYC